MRSGSFSATASSIKRSATIGDTRRHRGVRRRALVQAHITFTDETSQTVVSDDTWHFASGPILYDQVRSGETYDARLEKPNWATAAYQEDASWKPALTVPARRMRRPLLHDRVEDRLPELGATTLWEDWQGSGSLNHIFLGDITAWFFRALPASTPT